jgi:RNA polymerase sigma-70 factor (ECF subfamily)
VPQADEQASGDCEKVDQTDDLSRVLGRLPARHRSILKLHYIEQVSVGDIARLLDIPPGTVKSRLHKARAKFRQLWEHS